MCGRDRSPEGAGITGEPAVRSALREGLTECWGDGQIAGEQDGRQGGWLRGNRQVRAVGPVKKGGRNQRCHQSRVLLGTGRGIKGRHGRPWETGKTKLCFAATIMARACDKLCPEPLAWMSSSRSHPDPRGQVTVFIAHISKAKMEAKRSEIISPGHAAKALILTPG